MNWEKHFFETFRTVSNIEQIKNNPGSFLLKTSQPQIRITGFRREKSAWESYLTQFVLLFWQNYKPIGIGKPSVLKKSPNVFWLEWGSIKFTLVLLESILMKFFWELALGTFDHQIFESGILSGNDDINFPSKHPLKHLFVKNNFKHTQRTYW